MTAPVAASGKDPTAAWSKTVPPWTNAGRWGSDDQLGALNYITPDVRIAAAQLVRAGETVSLEGSMPLKLKVGNAAGTEAVFRGQALNLAATTRDNVARLELK